MLVTSDIYTLINYVGFINYLFYGVTVAGQVVLRWREPHRHRPIKVRNRLPAAIPSLYSSDHSYSVRTSFHAGGLI